MNTVTGEVSNVVSLVEDSNPDFAGPFDGPPIRELARLSTEDIVDLFEGRVLGVVQHDYWPSVACRRAAARVVGNSRMREYEVENVKRHGVSFMDVAMNSALSEAYFNDAPEAMRDLRATFAEYGSVVDQLQAQIDELWPTGAHIMTFPVNGKIRKLKRGTCREFPEGQKIDAHHDNFSIDAAAFPTAPRVRLQLSFNIYLRCAPLGGELFLYPRRIRTLAEEQELRDPNSRYGLRAELLGTPHQICPREGDLVVFLANRGHTVKPSFGGSRVTASLFAGLIEYWESLLLFN